MLRGILIYADLHLKVACSAVDTLSSRTPSKHYKLNKQAISKTNTHTRHSSETCTPYAGAESCTAHKA